MQALKPPDARRTVGPGPPGRARQSAATKPTTRCRSRAATRPSGSRASQQQVARGQGPQPDPAAGSRPARQAPPDRRRTPDAAAGIAVAAAGARRRSPQSRERRERPRRRRRAARSATRCGTCSATCSAISSRTPRAAAAFGPAIQFDTKGVEFGPWIRRFIAQVKRNWLIPVRGDVDEGARRRDVQRAQGRLASPTSGRRRLAGRRVQQRRLRRAGLVEPDGAAAAGIPVGQGVLHRHVLLQRRTAAVNRSQQIGLALLAVILLLLVRHLPRCSA